MNPRLVFVALLLAGPLARGDQGVRRDGERVSGTLSLTANGSFAFREGDRDVGVAELELVRFAGKPPPAPGVHLWHQVRLEHGEVLHGEVRALDETHLIVRTAWAERVAVPRAAVERVGFPGGRPAFFDSFDGPPTDWTTAGDPRVADGRLVFAKSGQSAETGLKPAVAAGRVGVTFRGAVTTARRLNLELGFVEGGKPAPVRIELVGPGERFTVEAPGRAEYDGRLKRSAGERRLVAEFDRDRLQVFVDGFVLWSREAGPGELRSVRLAADGEGVDEAAVADVLVTRADAGVKTRDWGDLMRDAVRSAEGDETFGTLAAAGPGGVTLELKGKKLAIRWPAAAEFTFRRGPVPERETAGEHVRAIVAAADGGRDVLDGAVRGFDGKALVLAHAVLGDLTIPRQRLEELRLRFHGRRVPVDATPHHLGTRAAFGFAVPKPEGVRMIKTVSLDAAPREGFAVVDAARVGAKTTPVEVRWNGVLLSELNRLADKPGPEVRAYRLAVPATAWRVGENEVEVRLRVDGDGGRATGVDVRAVRLEVVEGR